MTKAVQWAKDNARRYWFIVLVWAEWLALYVGRSLVVPFVYTGGDTRRYDAFETLKLFDQGRAADVPLYGMVLDLLELLFGENRFVAVVFIQTVVSAIALIYFYRTLKLLNIRESIARWIVVIYGFSTAASTANICVLTESFSLSGFLFVLYNVIKFVRYEQWKNGLAGIALTFALVFLRPQFLLQYMILLCYFVLKTLMEKAGRKTSLQLAAICTGGGYTDFRVLLPV